MGLHIIVHVCDLKGSAVGKAVGPLKYMIWNDHGQE